MLERGSQISCPHCEGRTKVIETGWSSRFQTYARRRQCDNCHRQFYTAETMIPNTMFRPKKPTRIIRYG